MITLQCTIGMVNAVTWLRNRFVNIQRALATIHRSQILFQKKRSFFGIILTIIIASPMKSLGSSNGPKMVVIRERLFSLV